MKQDLSEIRKKLKSSRSRLKKEYGVINIYVFGSYARGDHKEGSDVDILVDLEKPLGLKFYRLQRELENILRNKVDLFRKDTVQSYKGKWDLIKEDMVNV